MPFKKCMLQALHHNILQGINAAAVGQELSHTVSRCHPDLMGSTCFDFMKPRSLNYSTLVWRVKAFMFNLNVLNNKN